MLLKTISSLLVVFVLTILLCSKLKSGILKQLLSVFQMDVPKAPGLGLMLEKVTEDLMGEDISVFFIF